MGRVAFVSTSLAEALRQYRDLCATAAMETQYEDCPVEEPECVGFELLVSIVLGLLDPHEFELPEFDHEIFQAFWDCVEQIRYELLWRRMVRGPVQSIKLMNHRGLVLVEFQEHPLACLFKRS